jgi:hypothetical protein
MFRRTEIEGLIQGFTTLIRRTRNRADCQGYRLNLYALHAYPDGQFFWLPGTCRLPVKVICERTFRIYLIVFARNTVGEENNALSNT